LHSGKGTLRGLDRLSVPLREVRARGLAELRIRVESGPGSGAADAQVTELRTSGTKSRRRAADAFGPAREFLAEGDLHGVLQVRPAGLNGVGVARGLLGDRVGER